MPGSSPAAATPTTAITTSRSPATSSTTWLARPRAGATACRASTPPVARVRVVNNIAYRNGHDCITSWHAATQLTIVNNTVADCPAAGITVGSGDTGAAPRGNHDTFVANNLVLRNRQGIVETTDGRHPVGRGNHYVDNLIFASGPLDAFRPGNSLSREASVSGTLGSDPRLVRRRPLPPDGRQPRDRRRNEDAGARRRTSTSVARPQGRGVDIGAYEWRATAGTR